MATLSSYRVHCSAHSRFRATVLPFDCCRVQGSHAQTLKRHYPPLLPRATVLVSALRRHDRPNSLRDRRGVQLARRGANGLMKINLRQDFMPSAVLVMAGPIELFPQVVRRPLPFRGPHIRRTASRPPSTGRFSNGNSNLENTLVVEVDDQSTV